nr:hypothetical protein [Vitiosangium sp. GDMCC 1.1324]
MRLLLSVELPVGGDEDDGYPDASLAQLHEDVGPVEHGQHQVEHHGIELVLLHQLQGGGAVLRGGDGVVGLE